MPTLISSHIVVALTVYVWRFTVQNGVGTTGSSSRRSSLYLVDFRPMAHV